MGGLIEGLLGVATGAPVIETALCGTDSSTSNNTGGNSDSNSPGSDNSGGSDSDKS